MSALVLRAYEAGLAHRAAGETEQALEALSEALALDPTFAPAALERGELYFTLGEPEAALTDAQAAIAADPENGAAYALLGEVLRVGFADPRHALGAYERAVELDPELAEPTFPARWRAAVDAGQPNQMILLANEYNRAHPDDPLELFYRGTALVALGDPRAAIRTLVQQLDEEGPAAAWFALGEAYGAERSWANARICYEQTLSLFGEGDRSLHLVHDDPGPLLSARLGAAYVHTGECASGQMLLEHALALGAEQPDIHTLIGQAMICQTPTPTPTPYPWLNP
jgi:tetratricopeptide (TPR) repeat protein